MSTSKRTGTIVPAWSLALLSIYGSMAIASQVTATITDAKGQPLANAVVYVSPVGSIAGAPGPSIPKTTVIDQLDKEFVPRVSVLQTGTPVEFPNSDNIRHQVYSFSPAKTFTLKLYSGRPGEPVVFDKPGVVVLGCNIHDHMIAWVVAVDTPWFARTDAHGQAALRELPAGSYQLSVWHPAVAKPVASGRIDLGDGDQVERSIQLETGPLLGALDDPGTH